MGKWIFQDIVDLEKSVLYAKPDDTKEDRERNMENFGQALRNKIAPELYVSYKVWQCDLYVDLYKIALVVTNYYPRLSTQEVMKMARKEMEPHQSEWCL